MENENLEPVHCSKQNCMAKAHQVANVSLPITVAPFANVGSIMTECCDKPVITMKQEHCKGVENGTCRFTISQKIKVEIPVEFGANTIVGKTFVDCDCMMPPPPKNDEKKD